MKNYSEWENIPGFDLAQGKYVRLDCEAWPAARQIREEGKRRGKRNQPGSDETLPDEMYRKIEAWTSKRAVACKEDVTRYVNQELHTLHDLSSSWEQENPEINIDSRVTQFCDDLKTQASQNISDLDKQRTDYEEATQDLKSFRDQHKLTRVAVYPENKIAHWLWVPVAMIVESFISANLLGSVLQGGITEGWTVAFVLTLVNVLLGIWAGRSWRWTNLGWGFTKLFYGIQSGLCAVVTLIWNALAGHVRDVYVDAGKTGSLEALDKALANAWSILVESPLPWDSLQSAGLAFVGVAVFGLTWYKAYTSDDVFPGYGARYRKVEALRGRYQDDLNDALEELKSTRDKANIAIDETKSRYEMDQAAWKGICDRLHTITDDYSVNLHQYNKDLSYLLAAYRDANLAARSTPPPDFFGADLKIDEDTVKTPTFNIPASPEWGDIPSKAKAGFRQVEETYDDLLARYEMLNQVAGNHAKVSL